jgi:regulator of protease activity HflC (stomatin/prohibitin superfamily)
MDMKHLFSGLGVLFGLFVITTCFLGCRTVPAGYVGVQTRFGAVYDREIPSGMHIIVPWVDGLVLVDTKLRSYEIVAADSSSHDLQKIATTISIQHSLNPEMAAECYSKVGDLDSIDKNVINQAVEEAMKAVTAEYTAEELITHRAEVKSKVTKAITDYIEHTLESKGLNDAVHVSNVAMTNFQFSPEFNASIEAKVKAEQDSLRAENEKKKRITEAQAANEEAKLAADAVAYKTEVESKTRAEAIKREGDALKQSPDLIKLRATEKWNGVLPSFMGGQQPVPFIEVGK